MSRAAAAEQRAAAYLADPARRMPMDAFIADVFDPRPGEHMSLFGPNGCGKTTTALRLVAKARELNARTRAVALVMKPHKGPRSDGRGATGDKTVAELTDQLGGRVIRTWPPPRVWTAKSEPTFWSLWPEHTYDPEIDDERQAELFRRVILSCYQRGDWWVFGDEAMALTQDLKLGKVLGGVLAKGRSMKCGMVLATQRPAFVPGGMYSEAKHLFLWPMTDARAYDRIGEVSSRLDPDMIRAILPQLGEYECLYLRPAKREMVILT